MEIGGTGTTLENIQDWLLLDVGDPGSRLLTEEETVAVIFLFSSALSIVAGIATGYGLDD
jgi:hypothetical protein